MDLDLTDDQELMRDTTARFIESACPLTQGPRARRRAHRPGCRLPAPGRGARLVRDAGPRGVRRGHGVGQRRRRRRRHRRGARALPPARRVRRHERGRLRARGDGSEEQRAKVLPSIASGEAAVTWALASADGDWSPGAGLHAAVARHAASCSTGASGFVQDADLADWILVTASGDRGLVAVPRGRRHAGRHDSRARRARPDATVLPRSGSTTSNCRSSALVGQVGAASGSVDAPARRRARADGRRDGRRDGPRLRGGARVRQGPHRVRPADRLVPGGEAPARRHEPGARDEQGDGRRRGQGGRERRRTTPPRSRAWPRRSSSDSAVDLAQNCFQVFGGIGYTWEHDQHLYLRRLTTDAALYGDAAWHRERVWQFYGR